MPKPKGKKPKYMFDHSYGLFCPHCTAEQVDNICSMELLGPVEKMNEPNRTDECLFKCQKCGKQFYYSTQSEVTFNSRAVK